MKKTKVLKTRVVRALAVVAVFVAAGAVYYLWTGYGTKSKQVYQPTQTSSPHGQTTKSSAASAQPSSSPTPPAAVSSPGHPITSTLAKPTGSVFNKSAISLSSTTPQTDPALESTCQTVAGALCGLQLTGPNGIIKTIAPQATDDQGGVVIDWNAKTIGVTAGTWKVRLLASKNSQSSLGDSYDLTVSP